jgi:hypothetical protein
MTPPYPYALTSSDGEHWEALRGHTTERQEQDERTTMGWRDPGCPPGPQPPAQGWWDWWPRGDR